jgi:uncharacterized small protein (DUF1192 family)
MVDKLGALEDRSGGALPAGSVDELEKRIALLMAAQGAEATPAGADRRDAAEAAASALRERMMSLSAPGVNRTPDLQIRRPMTAMR